MGFEATDEYDDNYFETENQDIDGASFGEKPKKLSRKELREAKKRNAEKTANLPKRKGGAFSRGARLDDDDSLSGEHLLDPTQSTRISGSYDHRSDYEDEGPVKTYNSEFSYLFDEPDDDETEDDVYPDRSIYSDSRRAKELLGGLAYDEARDGDSDEYDRYFDEGAEVRPPSRYGFNRRHDDGDGEFDDDLYDDDYDYQDDEDDLEGDDASRSSSGAGVKVTPRKASKGKREDDDDNFLPELRPDSVFARDSGQPAAPVQSAQPEKPTQSDAVEKTESDEHDEQSAADSGYEAENYAYREEAMSQSTNDLNQEFMPYTAQNMYMPYQTQPMNQMIGYPVIMTSPTQSTSVPCQTIPVPYPVPMPYPMYGQGYGGYGQGYGQNYGQGYYPPPYQQYGAPDYGRPPYYPPYDDYGRPPRYERGYEARYGRADRDYRDYDYRGGYPPPYPPQYSQPRGVAYPPSYQGEGDWNRNYAQYPDQSYLQPAAQPAPQAAPQAASQPAPQPAPQTSVQPEPVARPEFTEFSQATKPTEQKTATVQPEPIGFDSGVSNVRPEKESSLESDVFHTEQFKDESQTDYFSDNTYHNLSSDEDMDSDYDEDLNFLPDRGISKEGSYSLSGSFGGASSESDGGRQGSSASGGSRFKRRR